MSPAEFTEPPFRHYQLRAGDLDVTVVETGPASAAPMLFLHGWPQTSLAFREVMRTAGESGVRAIAVDLPGIGASKGSVDGTKSGLASWVRGVVEAGGWKDLTLVGHDVGGQVVFSYLTHFPEALARAVIMDVVIPGITPWEDVIRNPHVWHFAFHAIAELPEYLVSGKEERYFGWFFDAISRRPQAISLDARKAYAAAYANPRALRAGFDWYRAFATDANENATFAKSATQVNVPTVYLRGEFERGEVDAYVRGLRDAGLTNVVGLSIPDSGHYAPEEQPGAVWRVLSDFLTAP